MYVLVTPDNYYATSLSPTIHPGCGVKPSGPMIAIHDDFPEFIKNIHWCI